MLPDSELDDFEKLVGDVFCKEVGQEANVWRMLPLFAATLALQSCGARMGMG